MELTDKLIRSYMDQEVTPPCVSLYIPTHPKSTSQRLNEDRIRLKNALQELEERDAFPDELNDAHRQLLELVDDNDFWLHRSRSLAVFANPDGVSTVRLACELTPVAHSGDRYAISPLLLMQGLHQTYYLLDIDFDQPKLYAGSQYQLELLTEPELPGSIEDVIDTEQRRNMSGERGGGSTTVHYGRGEAENQQANDISRYLQLLASSINEFLKDKSDPLFIAGSAKVVAELRAMLDYGHIQDTELAANYDSNRVADLHASSLTALGELSQSQKAEALERYASTDFEQRADGMTAVEVAADQGKVDSLLLPIIRVTTDGVTDNDEPSPLIELPDDFTAFEAVVRKVADQGGTIVPVEQADFAEDPTMKAILRY